MNTNDNGTPKTAQAQNQLYSRQQRPPFPKRAVVTAGMPYGNKELHFGHVGGMFVHADVFARFLRDRLGPEQVIFVSGTDCYGSAVEITYNDLVEKGAFSGTIQDFVAMNHAKQKQVLDAYAISPNLYAASALGEAGAIHAKLSQDIFNRLYDEGTLALLETRQFFDDEAQVFLNGRQVVGRCPIQGCKSEYAYADECSLGHQYNPEELIAPVSSLSGKRPSLVPIRNWCFDLQRFHPQLTQLVAALSEKPDTRKYLLSVVDEFLRPPMIYVKKEQMALIETLRDAMPPFEVVSEAQKASDALVFASLEGRAAACTVLDAEQIRYRTGKTLVPFRLSGNISWGIPVPEKDGQAGLTFWVWPESLWAPISFTKAYLARQGNTDEDACRDWWASKDARVYQFIGEDNIYFYAVAQMGLFMALQQAEAKTVDPPDGDLQLTTIVPNRHILYRNRKASSSSADKPPKAEALLEAYTQDQLRMHFFHLNLAANSVSFEPKAIIEPESKGSYDPVLYEGNILTNIYNRLVRSCFYYLQEYFGGRYPGVPVSPEALESAEQVILAYEQAMYRYEFGKVIDLLDMYVRSANKVWAANTKLVKDTDDAALRAQTLADAFHVVRVAATLFHPLVPDGTERVRAYLNIDERLWDWAHIFEPLPFFFADGEAHAMRHLEPRVDFFSKFV